MAPPKKGRPRAGEPRPPAGKRLVETDDWLTYLGVTANELLLTLEVLRRLRRAEALKTHVQPEQDGFGECMPIFGPPAPPLRRPPERLPHPLPRPIRVAVKLDSPGFRSCG